MEERGFIHRIFALWRRTARHPFCRAAALAAAAPVVFGIILMEFEVAHIFLFGNTFSETVAIVGMCAFGVVATLGWFIAFPILCWLAYCNDPREQEDRPFEQDA